MRVAAGTEEATAEARSVVALVTPHESLETQHGAYLVLVTPVVGEDLLVLIDNRVEQMTLLLLLLRLHGRDTRFQLSVFTDPLSTRLEQRVNGVQW